MAVDPYQTFLDTLATSEGDFEDRLVKLAELGVRHQEAARRKNYYKDLELDGIGSSLDTLIGVIDNPEGAKEAEYQLAAYRAEAGNNVEHNINAMTLQNSLERKKENVTNYGLAIQEASDMVDSGELTFEVSEYQDLPNLYKNNNAKRVAGGLKPHGSIMDYMRSERDRMNRLIGNISPGMKAEGKDGVINVFKHGKKLNNSDVYIYNKLYSHAQNIDYAMKALFNDGEITKGEAEALVSGPGAYDTARAEAIESSKKLFNTAQGSYNWWDNQIAVAEKGKYKLPDHDLMTGLTPTELEKLNSDSIDDQKAVMEAQKRKYLTAMETNDKKYYNWSGDKFLPYNSLLVDISDGEIEGYDDAGTETAKDAQGNLVSTEGEVGTVPEAEPEPVPYAEEEKILADSTKKGVKREGTQIITELKSLDQEEIDINESIAELQKEVDRFEEVKKELSTLSEAFGSPADMTQEQKERFEKLDKERAKLQQKVLMPRGFQQGTNTQIKNLNKKLSKLKSDRKKKKNKLKQYIGVS